MFVNVPDGKTKQIIEIKLSFSYITILSYKYRPKILFEVFKFKEWLVVLY